MLSGDFGGHEKCRERSELNVKEFWHGPDKRWGNIWTVPLDTWTSFWPNFPFRVWINFLTHLVIEEGWLFSFLYVFEESM